MAKRRRRRQRKQEREPLGTLEIVIAAALLFIIGLALKDATRNWHGVIGGYVWLAAFGFTFGLTFAYFAKFILPNYSEDGRLEGMRLLMRYSLRVMMPSYLRPLFGISTFPSPPPGVAESFSTLGVGFVDSHKALAIGRGGAFSRAAGPGFVKLNPGEAIRHVIDLRPHVRALPVEAYTRDGLLLETKVTVVFQVSQNSDEWVDRHNQPDPNVLYPYAREAIFRISYASGIAAEEEYIPWSERICPLAANTLITELSRKTLDDLYRANEPGNIPLERITERVHARLVEQLQNLFGYNPNEPAPVTILGVKVDALTPRFEIVKQRIENWQTEWQKRIYMERAEGDAEAVRRMKSARARAQMEMLENISLNLDVARQRGQKDIVEIINLRLIEAIEQYAQDNQIHAMLPQHVISALGQINILIDGLDDDDGSSGSSGSSSDPLSPLGPPSTPTPLITTPSQPTNPPARSSNPGKSSSSGGQG